MIIELSSLTISWFGLDLLTEPVFTWHMFTSILIRTHSHWIAIVGKPWTTVKLMGVDSCWIIIVVSPLTYCEPVNLMGVHYCWIIIVVNPLTYCEPDGCALQLDYCCCESFDLLP